MLTKTERWNLALDEIRAGSVLTENEDSTEAKSCRKHYPQVLAEMLDHRDFSFQTQRSLLTETAANDRVAEWAYAYALPGNMAAAIRVIPDMTGFGLGVPIPLVGDPYAEVWGVTGRFVESPYIISGTTLYTHVPSATLEYSINDITGLALRPRVERALMLDLAARLAVPVKGDREMKRELTGQARVAWEEAVADDRNRQPTQDGQYMSEREIARAGYGA